MLERLFVLSRVHTQDPVWEPCMLSLATMSEILSMCKNVLQFFKTMYDLTEGFYLNPSSIFVLTYHSPSHPG